MSLKQLRVINANSCTLRRVRKKVKWPSGRDKEEKLEGPRRIIRREKLSIATNGRFRFKLIKSNILN